MQIGKIRKYLETDVQAAFDGDPAAYSMEEIIYSYPGVYAITVYRIAHELFTLGVPLIPRIMTEHAHERPASISIREPRSANIFSSITVPVSSSVRRRP